MTVVVVAKGPSMQGEEEERAPLFNPHSPFRPPAWMITILNWTAREKRKTEDAPIDMEKLSLS